MALRFSPDGTKVLVDRDKGVLDVVPIAGGEPTYLGVKGALRAAAAERDWSKQAILTSPNTVARSTARSSARSARPPSRSRTSDVAERRCRDRPRWDDRVVGAYSGGPLKLLASYPHKLLGLQWSPDAKTLVIVGHAHDVVLVDMPTGTVRELRGHTDALYTVQWSRDGKRLLTASDDATARVWTLADGTSTVLRGHDDDVYRARFSANERQVATSSLDGSVRVWQIDRSDARTLTELGPVETRARGRSRRGQDADVGRALEPRDGAARGPVLVGPGSDELGMGVPSRDGELLLVPGADWSMELRRRAGHRSGSSATRAHSRASCSRPMTGLCTRRRSTARYAAGTPRPAPRRR